MIKHKTSLVILFVVTVVVSSCFNNLFTPISKPSFWYRSFNIKDTTLHGENKVYDKAIFFPPRDTSSFIIHKDEYYFGFKHILTDSGSKVAAFEIKEELLWGECYSDTSFFYAGKVYRYDSILLTKLHNEQPPFAYISGVFFNNSNFWFSFTKDDNDSTAYTFRFEMDNLIPAYRDENDVLYYDTLRIRQGKIDVSQQFESFVKRGRLYHRGLKTSEGFIK